MNSLTYSFNKHGCTYSVPSSGLHAGNAAVGKDAASVLREFRAQQVSVIDTELPTQHPFPLPLPHSKQNPDFVQVAIFLLDPTLCLIEDGSYPRVNHDCNEPKMVVPKPSCVIGLSMGT